MTTHLLNAAVMPQPGIYELHPIDQETFTREVRTAFLDDTLRHYIGYETTLLLIEGISKVSLGGVNRDQTTLRDGDVFLIARLIYRVDAAGKRSGREVSINDFEFFRGVYTAT